MLWVTTLEFVSPMSSGCFGWVWIQQRVRVCQVCTSHLDWTLLTGHLTDVKNFCSGLGARRSSSTRLAAWLARWVLEASPSRSNPKNKDFHHWNFPCQSSSLGTFIIIKNATDNHHHINGWKADQGQVSEMKTYILIQFFFNHIITAAITQVFLQVSMANQKNRAENGQWLNLNFHGKFGRGDLKALAPPLQSQSKGALLSKASRPIYIR